ncbi:MAG: hypothetical protein RL404_2220 [Pseudomonadota bacterium]|jgi:uncharacterized membrane protein YecN with MAPEG domain
MLIVTSLVASALTLFFIRLSFAVIRLRRANRVGIGSGGNEELERAIRAQGNFAEYVPFGLILIACLELNGAPWWLACIPGMTLATGRLIHAMGINEPPPNFRKRVLGMVLTINTLIALALLNMGWMAFKLLG